MRTFLSPHKKKKDRIGKNSNAAQQQHHQQEQQSPSQSPLQQQSNARHQSILESSGTVSSSSSHKKSATSTRTPTSQEESTVHKHHDLLLKTSVSTSKSTTMTTTTITSNKADQIANMVRKQADISNFFRQAALHMTAVLEETVQQQQQASNPNSNNNTPHQQQQQTTTAKAQQVCHMIDILANMHQQLAQSVAQIALEGLNDDGNNEQKHAAIAVEHAAVLLNNNNNNNPSTGQREKHKNTFIDNDNNDHHTSATTLPDTSPGSIPPWDENCTVAAAAATTTNANANIGALKHETSTEIATDDDDASLKCLMDQIEDDDCLHRMDENMDRTNAIAGEFYSTNVDDDDGIDNEYNRTPKPHDYLDHYFGTGDVATAAIGQIPSEIILPEAIIDLFALMQSSKDGDGDGNSNDNMDHEKALQYAMEQLRREDGDSGDSNHNNRENGSDGRGPIRLFL